MTLIWHLWIGSSYEQNFNEDQVIVIPEMAITCALGTALLTASGWMCTGPEIKCGEPCPSRDTHYSGWIETAPQVGPSNSIAGSNGRTYAGWFEDNDDAR